MGRFLAPKGEARIRIDGELYTIRDVQTGGYLPLIDTDGGEFYVAESSEEAGKAARQRWEEEDDTELRAVLGDEALIQWGLGNYANGAGSLSEWIDNRGDYPEEEFARYDGEEREVTRCGYLREEIGFCPTVAYRAN